MYVNLYMFVRLCMRACVCGRTQAAAATTQNHTYAVCVSLPCRRPQVHAAAAAEASLAAMRERQAALEALLASEMKLLEAVFPRQVRAWWGGGGRW